MSSVLNIIANISDDGLGLVPYRIVLPDFLPATEDAAKRMVNDIEPYYYCTQVWLMDGDWVCKGIQSALKSMDWSEAKVLEYDWDAKDQYGEKSYDPYVIWNEVADKKFRAPSLEPFICGSARRSERYAKFLDKGSWQDWTAEEVMRSPCWLFYYAKNVCKGRLPEVLDNCMTMKSFEDSENPWVKRYFGTKRYRVRNRKALASIPWAA